MSHKYKGCVIEVLDIAHGQRVKKFWESLGVDTDGYNFTSNKKDRSSDRFYGVADDNVVYHYSLFGVRELGLKIITLPTEVESGWFIQGSEDLKAWADKELKGEQDLNFNTDDYFFNPSKDFIEWDWDTNKPSGMREITFKEFLTIINKQKTNSYGNEDNTSAIKVCRPNPTVSTRVRPSGCAVQGRRSKTSTTRRHSSYQAVSY